MNTFSLTDEGKQVLLPQHRIMFGILVDVSGSMARTFGLDRLRSVGVKRAHAIITTFLKIIKTEVSRHEREDQIFVSAFGLAGERNNVVTCDLIALLNWLNTVKVPEEMRGKSAHAALISLARKEGYGYAEKWIKEELSWEQAQNLYQLLLIDKSLVKKLLDKLPDSSSAMVVSAGTDVVRGADWLLNKFSFGLFETHMGDNIQRSTVQSSEAYRYAEELIRDKDKIIYDILATMQHSQPKSVQYVLQLFHDLKLDKDDSYATSSNDIHSQIDEILNPIKPYIYGSTPMQKAMTDALDQFRNSRAASKVLFILTDGESTDGDPRMVSEEMKKMDVTVVTCYLTDQHIHDQKRLYDVFYSDSIDGGRKVLFDMSSTMHNIDPPVSYLVSAGWTLPASGESRLYVEANILDIVDELSETVVSQLNKPYDALVDVLNEVDITDMINRSNADFMPDKQDQNPCFAHAVAAVLHLAMHRIVGREGGYPTFKQIRDERLIPMYGKKGAHTTVVLEQVCPEYRLQVKEVDERGARNALNHRRPLVATFALCNDQWAKFKSYYKKTPDGILHKDDIGCK